MFRPTPSVRRNRKSRLQGSIEQDRAHDRQPASYSGNMHQACRGSRAQSRRSSDASTTVSLLDYREKSKRQERVIKMQTTFFILAESLLCSRCLHLTADSERGLSLM